MQAIKAIWRGSLIGKIAIIVVSFFCLYGIASFIGTLFSSAPPSTLEDPPTQSDGEACESLH